VIGWLFLANLAEYQSVAGTVVVLALTVGTSVCTTDAKNPLLSTNTALIGSV